MDHFLGVILRSNISAPTTLVLTPHHLATKM